MNKKYAILSIAVLVIVVFGFFSSLSKNRDVHAQSAQINLSGWGWSSNIGWVDFSKTTFSTTSTTGTLGGYAWSSNIGWISFNPAINSDCPLQAEDGGDCMARVNLATGKVQGWARALTGCQNDVWSGSACTASSSGNANGVLVTEGSSGSSSTWTAKTKAGKGHWIGMAMSSDGMKIAAADIGGYIHISTDGGENWATSTAAGARNWSSITMSGNGMKIAATVVNGRVYVSTDGGTTWNERGNLNLRWGASSYSVDGTKLYAATDGDGGLIYISTNDGADGFSTAGVGSNVKGFNTLDSTTNGSVAIAGRGGTSASAADATKIYISTNSGTNWGLLANSNQLNTSNVSMSNDGTVMAATGVDINSALSFISVSTNSGVTWTNKGTASLQVPYYAVAVSGDGNTIITAIYNGGIRVSRDKGATFNIESTAGNRFWRVVTSSNDGSKLAAADYNNGYIYTNGATAVTSGTSQNSGWDGWIHLSGVNHASPTYGGNGGVTFSTTTGAFTGYAWGGDVVGWLTFDPHVPGVDPVNCTTNCCGSSCGGSNLIGSCIADPSSLPIGGGSVDFTITPSNGTGPYSATGWTSSGNTLRRTFGSVTASMSAFDVPVTDSATGSGTITCPAVGVDTEAPTAKMWVNNNPALTLTKIRTGRSARLNWSVADYINDGYTNCVGAGDPLPNWSNISITSDKPTGAPYLLPITTQGAYTLKIRCSDPNDPLKHKDTNTIQVIVSDSTIEEI